MVEYGIFDPMSEGTVLLGGGPEPLAYVPTLLDADVAPDDVAAWAACMTPGSAVVKTLAVLDPARLSYTGRVDALIAMEKHIGWMQAQQHRLLAVMAAEPVVKHRSVNATGSGPAKTSPAHCGSRPAPPPTASGWPRS